MHKNKSAVTLIETLISLTIVGIVLVALLPVVTVRKASTVKDYGNVYWDNTKVFNDGHKINMNDIPYLCPKQNQTNSVSLGAGDIKPQITPAAGGGAQDSHFAIFNQGLGNKNNFPLAVTERLMWNDTTIKNSTANSLHIASDITEALPAGPITYTDSNNLYLNNNTTLILEQHATGNYHLTQTNNITYTMNKDYYDTSNNLINNNLTTINMNGDEYLHVNNGTQIGIGKNAVRKIRQNDNTIAIANDINNIFSATCALTGVAGKSGNDCLNNVLVIGAKPTDGSAFYNTPTDWIIHHSTTTPFTINANTVEFPIISAAKVILPSDRRLKTVISDYKKGIKELLQVKPVEFVYKNDGEQKHHIGVIAQDIQKIFPEAVERNSQTGYLMVGTEPVFYSLVNSIKELNLQNRELKYKNDELELKIKKLRKIRDDLKASQGGAK